MPLVAHASEARRGGLPEQKTRRYARGEIEAEGGAGGKHGGPGALVCRDLTGGGRHPAKEKTTKRGQEKKTGPPRKQRKGAGRTGVSGDQQWVQKITPA